MNNWKGWKFDGISDLLTLYYSLTEKISQSNMLKSNCNPRQQGRDNHLLEIKMQTFLQFRDLVSIFHVSTWTRGSFGELKIAKSCTP
jgi:hypothetical protein